jgi:hypothetical protein
MPIDAYGNYYANLNDGGLAVAPQSGVPVQVGVGAPNSSTPVSPIYLNESNGFFYLNPSLTPGGWILFTGSGSGVNNLSGTGSPVGSVTPNYVGQTYTDITNPSVPAVWVSVGLTNNSWSQIV